MKVLYVAKLVILCPSLMCIGLLVSAQRALNLQGEAQ
jgi:hypothetical protein